MPPIRLLIADDSAFMRVAVRRMVADNPDIVVIGEARNGLIAVNMAHELKPDVITMDVEMPELDGVEATRRIMADHPVPVIMLSAQTQRGVDTTIKALAAGAVDFISKSSTFTALDMAHIARELTDKIYCWARVPPVADTVPAPAAPTPAGLRRSPEPKPPTMVDLVVVGVSTGGPKVMPQLLRATGRLNCPMVVAQHMPQYYTAGFARHLHEDTGLSVCEGEDGMALEPGRIVILPGGADGIVSHGADGRKVLRTRLFPEAPIHPSADILFDSALRAGRSPVAVLLTGMGSDGALGALGFAARGLPVLVQNPKTCVVGGMPQSAIDNGGASHVLSLDHLGRTLKDWCNR